MLNSSSSESDDSSISSWYMGSSTKSSTSESHPHVPASNRSPLPLIPAATSKLRDSPSAPSSAPSTPPRSRVSSRSSTGVSGSDEETVFKPVFSTVDKPRVDFLEFFPVNLPSGRLPRRPVDVQMNIKAVVAAQREFKEQHLEFMETTKGNLMHLEQQITSLQSSYEESLELEEHCENEWQRAFSDMLSCKNKEKRLNHLSPKEVAKKLQPYAEHFRLAKLAYVNAQAMCTIQFKKLILLKQVLAVYKKTQEDLGGQTKFEEFEADFDMLESKTLADGLSFV